MISPKAIREHEKNNDGAQAWLRDHMVGTYLERFLKVADRFARASFPRRPQAEVVPGVCQRVRIARTQFERAFKAIAGLCRLLLVQIHASNTIESLGACRIIAQRNLK